MPDRDLDRRLGVVPIPFAGEAFVSWVDAMSATLRLSRPDSLRALGLAGRAAFSNYQFRLSEPELACVERRTGLRPRQVERMLFSFYAPTALPWLDPASGRSWRASDPWLRREHSSACPLCLQASGGRWLLSWRLKWTFLCADHLVYLVDRCPRCRTRLYWRLEATGARQRTHCTKPLFGGGGAGRGRRGAAVCGFPVAEIPVVPVGDMEAVHMQRRISALLMPADAGHNAASRRMLGDLAALAEVVRSQGTLSMVEGMEAEVVRAVGEARGQSFHPELAWVLENGSPAAVSVLVRAVGRVLLAQDLVAGAAWLVERCPERNWNWPLTRGAGVRAPDLQRLVALLRRGESQVGRRRTDS
ncbi:TniQ family protein [Streptomyces flavidovirens]|uniref:TniQ family protein n=1 Tax=Streptomyces flavidovirens TaxID=67298 RepID=UPI0033AEDF91